MRAAIPIKANSIQFGAMPSGIEDSDGIIKASLVLSNAQGIVLNGLQSFFPFLQKGTTAIVTISIVQVQSTEEDNKGLLLPDSAFSLDS